MTPRSPLADPRPYNPDGQPYFRSFDPESVPSPAFVVDRAAVEHNLRILHAVARESEAQILLALKAFALPAVFDLVAKYLNGVCASGVYEARMGRQEVAPHAADSGRFGVHTFAPAYSDTDALTLAELSDHLSFNSLSQLHRFRSNLTVLDSPRPSLGIRVNPEFSVGATPLYDPCAPFSRLGTTETELRREIQELGGVDRALDGVQGIHMHTLCENDSVALEATLQALDSHFGWLLSRHEIRWLNLGGGHHITKPHYRRDHLVALIRALRDRYGVSVLLEPGEAVAIHSGVLVTTVLDTPRNGMNLAILDTSATAHMPDTLEMPYRPDVWGSAPPDSDGHLYRLGGQTCLAGDVIGDYRFSEPLRRGDRLVFDDMGHYTMVKTTTFNGIRRPAIATWDSGTEELVVHRWGVYEDFRTPLG